MWEKMIDMFKNRPGKFEKRNFRDRNSYLPLSLVNIVLHNTKLEGRFAAKIFTYIIWKTF